MREVSKVREVYGLNERYVFRERRPAFMNQRGLYKRSEMPIGRGVESHDSDVHAHGYNIVHAMADGPAGWGNLAGGAVVGRDQEEGGADGCTRANRESKGKFTAEFVGRSYRCVSTGRR